MAGSTAGDPVAVICAALLGSPQPQASSPSGGSRPDVLAVDGRSGAGKTTLAEALGAHLAAPIVHLEDLYHGWHGLAAGIDTLVADVLEPLGRGQPVSVPRWDWREMAWGTPSTLDPPPPLLIVEGVGAAARRARAHTRLTIWLSAPDDVRLARVRARDWPVFEAHWQAWADQERTHMTCADLPASADLIVDSTADAISGYRVTVNPRQAPRDHSGDR